MDDSIGDPKENYRLYMKNAQEMLDIADENFSNQRYRTVEVIAKAKAFVEEVKKWLLKQDLL